MLVGPRPPAPECNPLLPKARSSPRNRSRRRRSDDESNPLLQTPAASFSRVRPNGGNIHGSARTWLHSFVERNMQPPRGVDAVRYYGKLSTPPRSHIGGQQCGRRDKSDWTPSCSKDGCSAGATRCANIPARAVRPSDHPRSAARQRIEEGLRRMLVRSIACINDRAVYFFGEQFYRATESACADDQDIRVHRIYVIAVSIKAAAPLLQRRRRQRDIFIVSPPRRLPASSNELDVRVEVSKRFMIVRPRKVALFVRSTVLFDIGVGQVGR